jgi:hypothetical protein
MVPNHRWRRLLALDLGIFNVGIFVLALIPPTTLIIPEGVAMALSSFAFVGVIAHATDRFHVPLEEWSYLLTGWVGLLTFVGFELLAEADTPLVYRVSVGLFLLSGVASAYAAHVIDGGRKDAQPRGSGGHRPK